MSVCNINLSLWLIRNYKIYKPAFGISTYLPHFVHDNSMNVICMP